MSQLSERAGAAMPCNNPMPRIASSPLIVSRPRQPKRLCVSRLTSTTDAGDHRLATGATAQRHPGSPGSPSYPFFLRAPPRPQAWRSRAYITFQSTCGPKQGGNKTDCEVSRLCVMPLSCSRFGAVQSSRPLQGWKGSFSKTPTQRSTPSDERNDGARRTSALRALSLSKSSPARGPISIISSRAWHRGVAWHAVSPTPLTATSECIYAGST